MLNDDFSKNSDPAEIAKFAEQANEWWNLDGNFKTLHQINPLRLAFIKQQVGLKEKKIMDVGCGGGILTESLAQERAQVTGIDLADTALNIAKQHAASQQLNIEYCYSSAEEMAEKNANQYDVVTCMELLEHVPDPMSIINACATLVKPQGYVFFSTINRNLKSYAFAILGAEYLLRLLPKGTHHYEKFIKPSELDEWARAANLELKKMTGLHYNPLTKNYSLQQNVDVNYLVGYQKK